MKLHNLQLTDEEIQTLKDIAFVLHNIEMSNEDNIVAGLEYLPELDQLLTDIDTDFLAELADLKTA